MQYLAPYHRYTIPKELFHYAQSEDAREESPFNQPWVVPIDHVLPEQELPKSEQGQRMLILKQSCEDEVWEEWVPLNWAKNRLGKILKTCPLYCVEVRKIQRTQYGTDILCINGLCQKEFLEIT